MSPALPFRSCARNTACATAAPSAVRLIASRATGQDSTIVCLTADLSDLAVDAQRRHAVQVLAAMAEKWPDLSVDVQIVGADNVPLLLLTQGGAS